MKLKPAASPTPIRSNKKPAETLTIDGAHYRLVPPPPQSEAAEVPFTPVTFNGKTYKLCFEMDQLCEAEVAFMRQGYNVNLLQCFGSFSLYSVRAMFACAVRHYHPELTYKEACDLITLPTGIVVGSVIARAFTKDLPDAPLSGEAA